jgi:thiamine-phosphate pyrophosphorylase
MSQCKTPPATQIYLMTPFVADAHAFAPALREALGAAEIASVLLNLSANDDHAAKRVARDVAAIVQPMGAALVINGWAAIVARAGADGIHIADGRTGLREAIESFKPERIVGAGNVRTRHEAMILAESGVDYVMFGEPDARGELAPAKAVVEQTSWWAELFEIPCVAYARDLAAAGLLRDAGADFVAVDSIVWAHPSGPGEGVAALARILAEREPAR